MALAFLGPQVIVSQPLVVAPAPHAVARPSAIGSINGASLAAVAVVGAVAAGARRRRSALKAEAKPLALPFLPEPGYRTQIKDPLLREMDAGFDPLDLAARAGQENYLGYREAEIKHGRLAMLATIGWLTAEEFQGAIARQLGLKDDLAPGELAPSLLNGGLGNLPSWFLPGVFLISAFLEVSKNPGADGVFQFAGNRVPGDLSFDPLKLRAKLEGDGYNFLQLHNAEVKHGRAAMVAITAFAFQEDFFKIPVLIEDEEATDKLVQGIDTGIEAVDKAAGLNIPDIPIPFPGA